MIYKRRLLTEINNNDLISINEGYPPFGIDVIFYVLKDNLIYNQWHSSKYETNNYYQSDNFGASQIIEPTHWIEIKGMQELKGDYDLPW